MELQNITSTNNWFKEILGLPTYIGSVLVAMKVSGGFWSVLLILLPFIAIYHIAYHAIFPNFEINGKGWRVFVFLFFQVAIWAIAVQGVGYLSSVISA